MNNTTPPPPTPQPTIHPWQIPGANHQPLLGNTHLPPSNIQPRATLILSHGFKGYKDYGFFPQLAHQAAQAGFITHRYNFSHSGMTNHIDTFERPDLFEQDTWLKQVHDLNAVNTSTDLPGYKQAKDLPTIWFGHSRGGITTLLTAGEAFATPHQANNHPNLPAAIITAAAPSATCRLTDEQREQYHAAGRVLSPSGRTGQDLYQGLPWLTEQEAHPDRHDVLKQTQAIACPLLILHGENDTTVPPNEATQIQTAHASTNHTTQLKLIPSASHTFNAPNPLPLETTPPPATQQMINEVIYFTNQTVS